MTWHDGMPLSFQIKMLLSIGCPNISHVKQGDHGEISALQRVAWSDKSGPCCTPTADCPGCAVALLRQQHLTLEEPPEGVPRAAGGVGGVLAGGSLRSAPGLTAGLGLGLGCELLWVSDFQVVDFLLLSISCC